MPSAIHRLDPRVKIVGTFVFLISVFAYKGWLGFAIVTAFLVATIAISKVPVSYMVRGFRTILLLALITAAINLFMTPGEIIWTSGTLFGRDALNPFLKITREGFNLAIHIMIRLIYLLLGASVMTLTTSPTSLTDGIEAICAPLKVIKVPVHEIAMMMSIALRFIPVLTEETDRIMKAQTARGAVFDEGGFITRAKAMMPLLIPLFVSAFRRAGDLAVAMEARCYRGGEGRTKYKPLKYASSDLAAYVIMLAYLLVVILLGRVIRI